MEYPKAGGTKQHERMPGVAADADHDGKQRSSVVMVWPPSRLLLGHIPISVPVILCGECLAYLSLFCAVIGKLESPVKIHLPRLGPGESYFRVLRWSLDLHV